MIRERDKQYYSELLLTMSNKIYMVYVIANVKSDEQNLAFGCKLILGDYAKQTVLFSFYACVISPPCKMKV